MRGAWLVDDVGYLALPQLWSGVEAPVTLSISELADSTLEIETDASLITISVAAPPEYAGSWTVALGDLAGGPVNLVPPAIVGTQSEGETLSVRDGLWIYDGDGAEPTRGYQWLMNGVPLPGETSVDLIIPSGEAGALFVVQETATDPYGSRTAESPTSPTTELLPEDGGYVVQNLPVIDALTVAPGNGEFRVEAA